MFRANYCSLLAWMMLGSIILSNYYVDGKVVSGTVNGGNFVFLSKFCFTEVPADNPSAAGEMQYTFTSSQKNTSILIYDDEKSYWPHVYRSGLTCAQKQQAKFGGISLHNKTSGTEYFRDVFQPHFWYIVASNCEEPVKLDYQITFLNYGNDKWTKQVSADEVGLAGLYLAFFILYYLGGAIHLFGVMMLVRANSYHNVVKLLTISILLSTLSVTFIFMHYMIYLNNGVGAPGLKGIGDLVDIVSQITFILLVVLLAKGWCISNTSFDDKRVVLAGLGILSVSYLVMFIWWNAGIDPADTLYIYMSPPGIITIVIRGLAMIWFSFCLRTTYLDENNPTKQQFYLWFGIGCVTWLLTLPLITGIAAGLQPWERLRTVTILYVTANALGQAGLAYLFWPTRASEYFQISSRLDLAGTIPYDSI